MLSMRAAQLHLLLLGCQRSAARKGCRSLLCARCVFWLVRPTITRPHRTFEEITANRRPTKTARYYQIRAVIVPVSTVSVSVPFIQNNADHHAAKKYDTRQEEG